MCSGFSKAALFGALSGVVVVGAIALTATGAEAKSTYESPYGYDRTWNAALRLVRVDNGWKVTEKDETNGYLLFEYARRRAARRPPARSSSSADATPERRVSVLVQLPQMPHYHEQVILDALASKMRREYGDPPSPEAGPARPESSPTAARTATTELRVRRR